MKSGPPYPFPRLSPAAARKKGARPVLALLAAGFLCVLLFGGVRAEASAPGAAIRDLVVTNSRDALLLYCTVANGFTPEMEQGIANGIPATFTFFVELRQAREHWPDKEIAALSFEHTLTYDPLKEEYRLDTTERGGKTVTLKDLREAKARLAEVGGVEVAPLAALIPDLAYEVRVKARLHRKDPPFFVGYLLPIGALWDTTTDWQILRFRY